LAKQDARPPEPGASSKVPVIVAVIGMTGVLGAALLGNWDKMFPRPAAEAAATAGKPGGMVTTAGANSPAVSGVAGNVTINVGAPPVASAEPAQPHADVAGRWRADGIQDAYDAQERFALVFEFEPRGNLIGGTVHELGPKGDTPLVTREILDGRIDGNHLSFATSGVVDDAGKQVTYRETYRGTVEGDRIAFTRHDDLPNGGVLEKFSAARR
jgi:hypothetical protein